MAKAPVPTPVQGDSKPAEAAQAQAEAQVIETPAADAGAAAPEAAVRAEVGDAKPEIQPDLEEEAPVEVRVLSDHLDFVSNSVATLSATDAAAAVAAGWADADPAAVAYAKALAKKAQADGQSELGA